MLLQHTVFNRLPLGSVRSGARIGHIDGLVINPHNLHIDAFYCRVLKAPRPLLLLPDDILDMSPRGIVINDHDHLLEEDDAIRLKPLLELKFPLIGLPAYVEKKRVGTVNGFSVQPESLFIQKIYVYPTLIQRINTPHRTFDRAAVKEITRQRITFLDSGTVRAVPVLRTARPATRLAQASSSNAFMES